ncbi:MAG: TolC family protein [Gemmatimonadetes bacterium]|nr:TolC family protein [Gemmatimonadota bacterium]
MNRIIPLAAAATLLSGALPCTPLGVALAAQQVPDSMTVEQAVQRVLATHPAMQEAQNGVAASAARVQVRQSVFTPAVVADGSYSRIGPTPTLNFGGEPFQLFPADNWDASVGIHHTIEDWGRRKTAVEQAQSFETTATSNVDYVRSRLAYQTIGAFYAVLFLRQNLGVQDEEIAALGQHLEIIQGKVEAGTATNFDALTTQVRIATAKSQRVDIANALEQRRIELRDLLGMPADTAVQPVGDFSVDSTDLNVDSLRTVALARRPDLKLARDAEASAEVGTRLAALANKPALNLVLSVGAKNGYVPDINQIKADFVAGMSVQLPVWQGDRTSSQVRAAEADVTTARSRTTTLERSITTAVEQAVAAVRAAREKIATTDIQVEQATQALALARTRYQAGVVTNLDVLDAETVLSEARLVQLRAHYDLVRTRYQLRQATGEKVW